jgi:L-malate glycosyltransferase
MAGRRARLLQVAYGMGVGGMEKVVSDLCRRLDRSRYEVAVYCTHVKGPLGEELEAVGIPVFHEPARRRAGHWLRPARIFRFLKEHRPDVVHTHNTAALLDSALAARAAGVPVLVHTDHSRRYPDRRRYVIAERWMSGLTDAFCAVSNHTRGELARFEGIPESRIEVVYNGLDLPFVPGDADRCEVRASLGLDDGTPVIGMASRLEWQKGHDLFVAAMPLILAGIPSARAVIVGGGSKEGEIREQIRGLGLEDKILLTGVRPDVPRIMAAFDLFVMTSNFEGMPIAALEAMAVSLPIVSTAVGGVPEMVDDGVTGRLVEGREPATFAAHVVELLSDRGRLRRLGEAGRSRYERHFRLASMIGGYDEIYRRCLAARSGL